MVRRFRSRVDGVAVIRIGVWIFAAALGAVSALTAPYRFGTDDAVSYLDIADAYRLRHWHAAINGYWSPMYSWVLAAADAILKPSPASEILTMRVVDITLCLLTLAAFERLLISVVTDVRSQLPRSVLLCLGYSAFLWSALVWIGVRTDTPDMCAAGCVYVAALLLRSAREGSDRWRMIALGAASAAAYLAKTAMLPVGIALVVIGSMVPWRGWRTTTRVAYAVAAFVLVAGPFIAALSSTRHHLSVGDAGKLNYAWYVYPTRRVVPNEHWQGEAVGSGVPAHPTRRVFTNPDVFEFDGPIDGTYPPWTDPSYWYEGLTVRFNAAAERRVLAANLEFCAGMALPVVLAFYVAVYCLGGFRASVRATIREQWPLLVLAAIGLSIYLFSTDLEIANIPSQPSTRFVAPFITLLLVAMLAGVRLPDSSTVAAAARLSGVTTVVVVAVLAVSTMRATALAAAEGPVPWVVADQLLKVGIGAGDRVAILGRKYDRDHDHEFWARLARVHIVSHVPDEYAALHLPADRWADLCAALARTGARALVYKAPSTGNPGAGWATLTDGYYAYLLQNRQLED